MSKSALLLSSFLTSSQNDINLTILNVIGNTMEKDVLKKIIDEKSMMSKKTSYIPGHPQINHIETKYENYINEYANKYKEKSYFQQDWCFKSIEIKPLLCTSIYLDVNKIEKLQVDIKECDYSNILKLCLDLHTLNIRVKPENNGLTLIADNSNLVGLTIGPDLNIKSSENPSPIKISRINNRYVLIDGVHRAVALLREGYTHVPAMLFDSDIRVNNKKEFFFNKGTLLKEFPPTVGHYLNETSISVVPLVEKVNVFRILIDKLTITV